MKKLYTCESCGRDIMENEDYRLNVNVGAPEHNVGMLFTPTGYEDFMKLLNSGAVAVECEEFGDFTDPAPTCMNCL